MCLQRRTHKRKPKVEATSAYEAMEKMLQEKKLSKKINYDVLKDLNPAAFKPDTVEFTQVIATTKFVLDAIEAVMKILRSWIKTAVIKKCI